MTRSAFKRCRRRPTCRYLVLYGRVAIFLAVGLLFLAMCPSSLCNGFVASGGGEQIQRHRQQQQKQQQQQNQKRCPLLPTRRLWPVSSSALHAASVGKSGGKLIRSEEEFSQQALEKSLPRPVMVFFTAPWCGPCRLSNPVVKEVKALFVEKIDVLELCTDDLPEVAEHAGVVSIPTIQLYYQGECLDTIVGCVAQNVLASAVTKILEDTTEKDQ